jgi:hypothetical protein
MDVSIYALDEAIASSRLPEVIVNNPVMLKSATAQMLESIILFSNLDTLRTYLSVVVATESPT